MQLIWVNGCNIFTLMSVTAVCFIQVCQQSKAEHREDALKVIHRTLSLHLSCLVLFHQNDGRNLSLFFLICNLDHRLLSLPFQALIRTTQPFWEILEASQVSPLPAPSSSLDVWRSEERRLLEVTFLAAAWQVTAPDVDMVLLLKKQEKGEEFQHLLLHTPDNYLRQSLGVQDQNSAWGSQQDTQKETLRSGGNEPTLSLYMWRKHLRGGSCFPSSPPVGRWNLSEVSDSLYSRSGGHHVHVRQRRLERLPKCLGPWGDWFSSVTADPKVSI